MKLNLDDMSVKQLRKHAKEVAKALARKEAIRANEMRKKVVDYAVQLGSSIGGHFSKDDPKPVDTPSTTPTKTKPVKAASNRKPKYLEADGTPRYRTGKWSEKYSESQLEEMTQK